MKISIDEIEEVTRHLFAHLRESGVELIDLDADFYWNVSLEQRYNVNVEPNDLDVGQLSDDWGELMRIARGDAPPIAYALVWLSAILRYVGETTPR